MELEHAIRSRLHVEFTYARQPRIVQPGALGRHRMTGETVLRGFQVGGRSNSIAPPFWTLFTVADILDLVVTDRAFVDQPWGYLEGDGRVHPVFAAL